MTSPRPRRARRQFELTYEAINMAVFGRSLWEDYWGDPETARQAYELFKDRLVGADGERINPYEAEDLWPL